MRGRGQPLGRECGLTLLEVLVTTTLLGVVVLMALPLTFWLASSTRLDRSDDALEAVRSQAVPQLRRDLRGTVRRLPQFQHLRSGPDVLLLEAQHPPRTIVWLAGSGRLVRRELVHGGGAPRLRREREWAGGFAARIAESGELVGLDVDDLRERKASRSAPASGPRPFVRFRHRVGR